MKRQLIWLIATIFCGVTMVSYRTIEKAQPGWLRFYFLI